MKDQFVTYEIAKRLKELGFNEECITIFGNNKEIVFEDDNQWLYAKNNETMSETENPTAPLWQQAIKFIYEESGEWIDYNPDHAVMQNKMTETLDFLDKKHGLYK